MMKDFLTVLVLVTAMSMVPEMVTSQRVLPAQDRPEMERRLRARFGTMVMEQLELGEDVRRRFNTVLRDFQERQELLGLRESQLRRRLRDQGQLRPQLGAPLLSEEDAGNLLDEMAAIQLDETELFRQEQTALLEFLTVPQLVRFYAMREALSQRVNALRRGGPPGGGRRGGGFGPREGGRGG